MSSPLELFLAGTLDSETLLYLGVSSLCVYWGYIVLSRLVFHPLAGFPGPKLAALTDWYEFYFNVVQQGQYTFHIEKLHARYGPIVRVNPTELHIRDSDFHSTIYALHSRDKSWDHNQWFDAPTSTTATTNHDHHRLRRSAINGSLNKTSVVAFESHIQASVDKFIDHLKDQIGSSQPVNLTDGFRCYAGDVIAKWCFGENRDLLSSFRVPRHLEAFEQLLHYTHINMNFPWLINTIKSIPDRFIPEPIYNILEYQRSVRFTIENIMAGNGKGAEVPWVANLLSNPNLPDHEKTVSRLADEAITLLGAGEVTIHSVLALTIFYLLQQPETWKELKDEILTIYPDVTKPPLLSQLEKLPLLTSTVIEGLRLSYGEVGRSPRLCPEPLGYGKYTIPPQTLVSMSQYSMHHNETLFPDSYNFHAKRFLNDPRAPSLQCHDGKRTSGAKKLARYMTSFGKGTRECGGMNLSYAELYLILANMIRRCEFQAWQTTYKDVGFIRDFAIPVPAADSTGMQVLVLDVE